MKNNIVFQFGTLFIQVGCLIFPNENMSNSIILSKKMKASYFIYYIMYKLAGFALRIKLYLVCLKQKI